MADEQVEQTAALRAEIAACRHCAERFAATETAHAPRPVFRGEASARVLIAGQAPGARVHASGIPFDDPSGDRLRAWMGVDRDVFYDASRIAMLPMAFCFPGYDAKGSDLPPPPDCARLWREKALGLFPRIRLTLCIGQYAQRWHLKTRASLTDTVRGWRAHGPALVPLPHPSWRNTGWLKRNPWFEAEVLPWLRTAVAVELATE
ncbi:MAG: uracil-DNA glycosylase family protein [Pseudomonadota bacterium]